MSPMAFNGNQTAAMPSKFRERRLRLRLLGAALAVLWVVLAVWTANRKSPVADEFAHIGAGVSYLKFFDFRMNPEHPILVKLLAGLPVYLFSRPPMEVEFDIEGEKHDLYPWVAGQQSSYGRYVLGTPAGVMQQRVFLARLPMILIGLLGGVFIFLLARLMTGREEIGLLAAACLLFYPEYLGHAVYVTLDVPLAASCAAISWASLAWYRRPTWRRTLLFVAVAAVTSQVKLPASFFCAASVLTLLALACFNRERVPVRRAILLLLLTVVAGIATAWLFSGFRFSATNPKMLLDGVVPHLPPATGDGVLASAINFMWTHKLLPETTLATLNHVTSFEGRIYFLMGEFSRVGWYHYFLVTFLLKTPLHLIAMLLVAGGLGARRYWRGNRLARRWLAQRDALIVIPYLVVLALVVISRANLGHRYILFLYIPISILIAGEVYRWLRGRKLLKGAACAFLAVQAVTMIINFPHYATYFNLLVGNPYGGSKYLWDSNVDWGQDMRELETLVPALREKGYNEINIATFGFHRLSDYGVGEYRYILPSYPFIVYEKPFEKPDFSNPTIVGLEVLESARILYPELDREPDAVFNSLVVFAPQ